MFIIIFITVQIKLELKLNRSGLGLSSDSAVKVGKKSNSIPNHSSSSSREKQLAITMKRFKEAGMTDIKMDVDDNTR
jgi:hypothetical protein